MRDVSAEYEAGLWVPSNYGLRLCLVKKDARIPVQVPEYREPNGGFVHPATTRYTDFDAAALFDTVEEAQAECDRRNTEGSSKTPPGYGGETV